MVVAMKNHISGSIYDTFYIMKDINYQLNNPLDTKKAPKFDLNILRFKSKSKISRNSRIKFILI